MDNGSGSGCTTCKTVGWVSVLVYVVTTLIALYGAYNTHFLPSGFVAGTAEASLALVALLVSVTFLVKAVKKACPCGCGCGGNCNCSPR